MDNYILYAQGVSNYFPLMFYGLLKLPTSRSEPQMSDYFLTINVDVCYGFGKLVECNNLHFRRKSPID